MNSRPFHSEIRIETGIKFCSGLQQKRIPDHSIQKLGLKPKIGGGTKTFGNGFQTIPFRN